MTAVILARSVSVRVDMRTAADNAKAPHWFRLGALARVHTNEHGHAPMREGQIARELRLTVRQVSNAITSAKAIGWIDPSSTARCLVLPDQALSPCEERHR